MRAGREVALKDGSRWRVDWTTGPSVGAAAEHAPLPTGSGPGIIAEQVDRPTHKIFVRAGGVGTAHDFFDLREDQIAELLETFLNLQ